eukprot:3831704-Karenia_brevis.AAC.1
MVRPSVANLEDGTLWGGYDLGLLRIAALARAIQTKLYLHKCSPAYCLKERDRCRFFFPWPEQPYQQHDANTDRLALQRRLAEDDQSVNPHNWDVAMFSPSIIH